MKRQYRDIPAVMGIYAVRNRTTGQAHLGWSLDVRAMLNRSKFELDLGTHAHPPLQADDTALGTDAFEFVVLDVLEPKQTGVPRAVYRAELEALHALWLEQVPPSGGQHPPSR